jgi:hypothetical protein
MHWCHNETTMLLLALPFIGFGINWLRGWVATRKSRRS